MKKLIMNLVLASTIASTGSAFAVQIGDSTYIGPLGATTTLVLLLKTNEASILEDAIVASQSEYEVVTATLAEKLESIRAADVNLVHASDKDLIEALIVENTK
jgi:hypothetical protein